MVAEAEKFAEEDKAIKERIDAMHALKNYIYSMRNTIEDKDKLADKLDEDDKAVTKLFDFCIQPDQAAPPSCLILLAIFPAALNQTLISSIRSQALSLKQALKLLFPLSGKLVIRIDLNIFYE